MIALDPGPSRWSHLLDAVTLGYSAGALVLLALLRASVLDAVGIIFALPIVIAAVARIVRGLHFAITGHAPRARDWTGAVIDPPARLGRPSWERRPNGRCS